MATKISRTEAIPFREEDGSIMQMKQYEVTVEVTQEENQTLEEMEKLLDIVFDRNIKKTLWKDPIYNKQKKQLNFLVNEIKKLDPVMAKKIILAAQKLTHES